MSRLPLEHGAAGIAERLVGGIAAAGVCLLVLWPFRLYGFDLVDEGTQLAQIARVASGERPYLDFETGYTPGYFAFEARLLGWGDGSIVALRTFGVLWQALLVGVLWASLCRWTGRGIATAVAALYVGFLLPVSLRSGAPFNIPYPGWLAAGAALLAQCIVTATPASRRSLRLASVAVCGVAAGLAFSVKPNAGLLTLAATSFALIEQWSPLRASDRVWGGCLRALAIVATGLLLAPGYGVGYGLALLAPLVLVAARIGPATAEGGPAFGELLALAVGFLGVVLPWFLPLVAVLGVDGVLRDVLLVGGGVVEAYLAPFAWPGLPTGVFAAGLFAARWSRSRPGRLPLVFVVTALLGALAAIPTGARLAAENLLLWLGPLLLVACGVGWDDADSQPRERAAAAFLAVFSLQLFPRPDLIHVAMGGPSLLLVLGLFCHRHAQRWRAAEAASAPWFGRLACVAIVILSLGRLGPALLPRLTQPTVDVGLGARAPVEVVAEHAPEYAWIAALRSEIERRSAPDEAIFTFPDIAGLAFLSGRPQPFHHLYFVPGRPDRAGEERTLGRLQEVAPALMVMCPPHVEAFAAAPAYFARLGEYAERAYAPVAEAGGCAVRVPRDG